MEAHVEVSMATFVRDESHWLFKLSPDEWIRAALADLRRAEEAYHTKNVRGGLAGARRAAGMALNGALIVEPNDAWGRTYVQHLTALSTDTSVPARVSAACQELLENTMPGQTKLITLRTSSSDLRVLEAARDVIAHAYAVVTRHQGKA